MSIRCDAPAGMFHAYVRREPVGVCAQIVPWNFPLLMAVPEDRAGARRRLHRDPQARRADAADRAAPRRPGRRGGLPGRRDQHHHRPTARPPATGMVRHPDVDKVAFTGSTEVGKIINRNATDTLKRVTLELGGKSPVIVLPDVDVGDDRAGRRGGDLLQLGPGLRRRLAAVRAPDDLRQRGRGRGRQRRLLEGRRPASTPTRMMGPLVSTSSTSACSAISRPGKKARRVGR